MTWMSLFSLCFQTAGAYVATITAAIMVDADANMSWVPSKILLMTVGE